MKNIKSFEQMVNENLKQEDAEKALKDIFKKKGGKVNDEYLKDIWKEGSTLRNLYGKSAFDKVWDKNVKNGNITTEDGKTWEWKK
jgi:hypothetical protein